MIFDDATTWTASYTKPDESAVASGEFALVKYNGTDGEMYIVNTSDLTTISGPTLVLSDPAYRNQSFFPDIRARQSWGPLFVGTVVGGDDDAVLPCDGPYWIINGSSIGAFYVKTWSLVIVDYVQQLKVATSGRVLLVDHTTGDLIATNNPRRPTYGG